MKHEAKVQLRLPADVHQWVVKWAQDNDRSMNGQLISLLREKMRELSQQRDGPGGDMLGG